jgi:ribosomal protein L1
LKHIKTDDKTPKSGKNPLFTETSNSPINQPIFFQLTTKHILTSDPSPTLKPLTIQLPHSPYPTTSTALVITKDPHDTFAEKCRGNPRVQQVLGLGALRKTYNSYEQLRRLRDGEIVGEEPAIVLADETIVVSLPKALGKAFYKTPRTTPIAVRITPGTITKVVEEAFGKTYARKNSGNCITIRIGFAAMEVEQLVENCVALWERCVEQKKLVKTGIHGVRSGFIKSGSSVALPVWMAGELYSAEDILEEEPTEKKVKSKAERKLMKPVAERESDEVERTGTKRGREDDVEKSFEEKRARKLAKAGKVKKSEKS